MDSSGHFLYDSDMAEIKNFNLFGERGDFPDVVHCETIETRSRIHDWEFQPHRHARLHQFLLIEDGGGRGGVDASGSDLGPGMLINVPTGVVHEFSFWPGTRGWVVTLASEVMDDFLQESEGLLPALSRPEIILYSPKIKGVVEDIFSEFLSRDFARAHILRSLSAHLAGLVAREIALVGDSNFRPGATLQRRFETLLEKNYLDHLTVADYANLLAVTPTHLSRVMRRATGRSASAAIEERIIREARRNLAYSNLRIAEIAYQLGYTDPAYFSRVFSRGTGMAPRAFRARIETSDTRI